MTDNERIGSRIKQRRELLDMTQEDLGRLLSLNKSTIQRYESGEIQKIKIPILEALSKILHVNPNWLALKTDDPTEIDNYAVIPAASNVIPLPEMINIPLVGSIACGEPITATENLEGYVKVPTSASADFALTCKGDSMIGARIMDGDVVLIRQQPDVEDGEIAAVLIENEATLKRVYKLPGRLILRPENPLYQPMDISGPALDEIRILGKAVYFISLVK